MLVPLCVAILNRSAYPRLKQAPRLSCPVGRLPDRPAVTVPRESAAPLTVPAPGVVDSYLIFPAYTFPENVPDVAVRFPFEST